MKGIKLLLECQSYLNKPVFTCQGKKQFCFPIFLPNLHEHGHILENIKEHN